MAEKTLVIGILAIQGAVEEHVKAVEAAGIRNFFYYILPLNIFFPSFLS